MGVRSRSPPRTVRLAWSRKPWRTRDGHRPAKVLSGGLGVIVLTVTLTRPVRIVSALPAGTVTRRVRFVEHLFQRGHDDGGGSSATVGVAESMGVPDTSGAIHAQTGTLRMTPNLHATTPRAERLAGSSLVDLLSNRVTVFLQLAGQRERKVEPYG